MELLNRTTRNLRRLLGADTWFTCVVVGVLGTVEVIGRRAALSDVHDALAAAVLAVLAVVVAQRHRETRLVWVQILLRWFRKAWRWHHRSTVDIGVDLRGVPVLPQRIPPLVRGNLVLLGGAVFLLLVFAELTPNRLRSFLIPVSYLVYLAGLVALWASLAGATMVAVFIPSALIHDAWVSQHAEWPGRPRWPEAASLVGYFGTLLLAGFFLPAWTPLAVCAVGLVANLLTITIPSNPDVHFIWRYQGAGTDVRSVPWGRWMVCQFTLRTLVIVVLILLARGGAMLGAGGPEVMPLTAFLGWLLAWLGPGALAALVVQMVARRLRDPARPCQPTVHIAGPALDETRSSWKHFFRRKGWHVRLAPKEPEPTDVRVKLVQEPADAQDVWPLRATAEELQGLEVLHRLRRRDEIQMRRKLMAGLERLFKFARRSRYRRGTGFLVAPHYWFFPGLIRDTQEDEINLEDGTILSGIIGPTYHQVLPRAVRHHVYQILRAVQIDLIFVEDGVGFRRFTKVLRMLFELYDVYGGRRKAQEIHFTGLPGIRVLIHEYQLDKPFKSEVYPEPDYEDFGRARILHVFKDRGEQEELLETPMDLTRVPVGSGAL